VRRDALAQLALDLLHDGQAALLLQRVAEQILERLLLFRRGQRGGKLEERLHERLVVVGGISCVVERVVEIGPPTVEGGEEEAGLGRRGRPGPALHVEFLLLRRVAERGFRRLHGADRAENVGKDLARGLAELRAVAAAIGHVVALVREQDEIVSLRLETADDSLVEGLERRLVLELRVAQRHEQAVLRGVRDLLCLEPHVEQIAVDRAREGLLEQGEIGLTVLLGHEAEGLAEGREDLAAVAHVAAADGGDVGAVGSQAAPQLADFFIVHSISCGFRFW